jgi:hypothetical protein
MVVIIGKMITVTVDREERSKAKSTYANQPFLKTRERIRERGGWTSSNLWACLGPGGLSRKVRSLRSMKKVPGGLERNGDQRKLLASSP